MIFTKTRTTLVFFLFIAPALLFYSSFVLFPLYQGVVYSFTDWNGITPEIPPFFDESEFETKVLGNIKDAEAREILQTFYITGGNLVKLKKWIEVPGKPSRKINNSEKNRIKKILKSIGISSIKNVGFANFREIFTEDSRFPGVVGFTVFFTLSTTLCVNIAALLLAAALDAGMRSRNILRSMFFIPNVLSLIIVAFIWWFIFPNIIPAIPGTSGWLGDPVVAPFSCVIVSTWQQCGYIMIIYLAGLQSIPEEVLEAAKIDGASMLNTFMSIKLPLLLPAFTIAFFLTLTNTLKNFDVIFALTGGGPAYATTSVVIDLYNNAFLQNRFGYATAKAVVLCLTIMVVTGFQLVMMKRKEKMI